MKHSIFVKDALWGRELTGLSWLLIVVAVLSGLGWLLTQPGEWHETGEGVHSVYVTSVEKEGLFWRTWNVWVKTDLESTQEEWYCVRPAQEQLIPMLEHASRTNQRVELSYTQYLRVDYSECNSLFFDGGAGVIKSAQWV